MDDLQIRFDDGAEYEGFMGLWSRLAGDAFLRWLAPPSDARWVDVGCGNGAFTERIVASTAPRHVDGIDPSPEQLAYARTRLDGAAVRFDQGDAMALPYGDASFDVAVMALVLFFVPDPAVGVAEMARVVRPGGLVTAYTWDILGAGFPYATLQDEMNRLGVPPLYPPSFEASRMTRLVALWTTAGLDHVETEEIRVERTFADFDTYWAIAKTGPRMKARIDAMPADDVALLRQRLQHRLVAGVDGSITCEAVANAIRGRRPG